MKPRPAGRGTPELSGELGCRAIPINAGIGYKGAMDRFSDSAEILHRRHWIFDLDGTLTVAIHDFAGIRRLLGVPEGTDILGHLEALPEAEGLAAKGVLGRIEDELAERTEPAVGALELWRLLHGRGVRLGVLTRNTRLNALQTLSRIGLARYVDPCDVLGREDALAKPDPDGILKLALGWETSPTALVMVGDYAFDLQSGRAAGAATIHVDPTGVFRWPELTDIAVASLSELELALV